MVDPRTEQIRALLPQGMLSEWVRLGTRLVRLLRDERHSGRHDEILDRLLEQARQSAALRERRGLHLPRVTYPESLPITSRKSDIVEAIRAQQVLVIAGETGSGKTTQIPKMCLEAGLGIEGKIGCTQPRRVAALSISRRIAEELGVAWGGPVGCKIRFDDRSSSDTYIKVMTDGILLAETQGDPLLSEYNALIIDEAHERSLNIDFLLGHLKGLLKTRPELKLIITSATIDTEAFSRAFERAPVIEVSGRVFPVEVVYAPVDLASEERGELTYIDAAVQSAERVLRESAAGDLLIFMPTERDIRETSERLKSLVSNRLDILPLFGRLSSGEQQRVFASGPMRKVVVATNIAETSLTIPGIRYVIDSGLARLSRYNPRTRTRRLPIEPIARSSSDQRKGRAGRVEEGVCIRLYSEEDYEARPRFTQPEIQRANLAEVILKMKAFRLGEIETFPFLDPPTPAAIQGGYKLLQELGALDDARDLTALGRDLARLPIDPTLGRMLLQAEREGATPELLVIAAGLSIQDPRERPLDLKESATAAHKQFAAPESDFLTLLNIWGAVHEQWERLETQNQRRKFCKANFLSYVRMREWQDLHAQLDDALEDLGLLRKEAAEANYAAIHRSILSGLLGHLAERSGHNSYKGAGNRELALFPGSVLFSRPEKPRKGARATAAPTAAAGQGQPAWIVAGEIVETSRLFARTVAGIDPLWIVELGAHLCRVTHHHPRWSPEAGQVLAEERTTLYGLEVRRRDVAYANVNSEEATAIFIRSALVEDGLFPRPEAEAPAKESDRIAGALGRSKPPGYDFLEHNRQVRQKIEIWQTRMRQHDGVDLDEAFFKFYSSRLENVASVHELNRFLRDESNRARLRASAADLMGKEELSFDAEAFPDHVELEGWKVPLSYAYTPGEEQDGVTLTLDPTLARSVAPAAVEWAVPGLREAQVSELLRALPKALRRQLMPFPPKVAEILRDLRPSGASLKHDLAEFLRHRYGVAITATAWAQVEIPQHVRPRIQVAGSGEKPIGAGRNLVELRRALEAVHIEPPAESQAWTGLAQSWERFGLTRWSFGDLPAELAINEPGESSVRAWPGLEVEDGGVNVRLFRSAELARRSSLAGIQRLLEIELQKDLGWMQKDLKTLVRLEPLHAGLCSSEALQTAAFAHLKRHLLAQHLFPALAEEHFRAAVNRARALLPGLASQLGERLKGIFELRRQVLQRCGPSRGNSAPQTIRELKHLGTGLTPAAGAHPIETELNGLMPTNFLEIFPFTQLEHLPRYLKALFIRAERATLNPVKDQERARQLAPYVAALGRSLGKSAQSGEGRGLIQELRWMVEEFKVSLFAQELGTAFPVSAKRLDQQLARIAAAAG